jgi:hypothetical protein
MECSSSKRNSADARSPENAAKIADTAETAAFRKGERASAHAVEQILAENVPERSG